jgi:hypothetical protein
LTLMNIFFKFLTLVGTSVIMVSISQHGQFACQLLKTWGKEKF